MRSLFSGEVSDSGSGGESDDEKFYDGYDENLIGDDEDKARLEQMTEKEREQELFNRMERRQVLKTRSVSAAVKTEMNATHADRIVILLVLSCFCYVCALLLL